MTLPVRELLISQIADSLAQITSDNGYEVDLGAAKVLRNQQIFNSNTAPAVSLWDTDREERDTKYNADHRRVPLQLDVLLPLPSGSSHADASTLLNVAAANVENGVMQYDDLAEQVERDLFCQGMQLYASRPGETVIGFSLFFELRFNTVSGDPFTVANP